MPRWMRRAQMVCSSGALLAIGGCFTSAQLTDFARTEVARITSDVIGQLVAIFLQATSPVAGF